jgi:hypothetical protein
LDAEHFFEADAAKMLTKDADTAVVDMRTNGKKLNIQIADATENPTSEPQNGDNAARDSCACT